MTYLLPPLNALRAFEAAGRHLSFKQAAHELHVTAGAVSQQVRLLEERLGVQLFERLTRQIILTSRGEAYLIRVREAFRCLADATADLRPEDITSLLHIGVHASFDIDGLRARLAQFRRAQPQIAIRLSQPAGLHELLEGKVDVVIAERLRRYPGYRCEPLESGFLICPSGTADCPEIEILRSCLLDHVELEPTAKTKRPPVIDTASRAARASKRFFSV
ncbi:LysR family transcriptional regulator [Bradyrhizobium sp. LHD-71]|uniref:LysR family transcriptional regulator n=1 Tax=Bradyrhizobium sp. LHD-71 TaxID=3072141 RepID=UPI00280FE507|nr:LysR family transcriptional regulator [Bradyrhizobium sp. LHD-71]MDQ8731072.1 LysR family transcriptional regulator [Bradyrhizobium sp. LHD-71]